jgi:hypothetical protein
MSRPPEFWQRFLAEIVAHPNRSSPSLGVFSQVANRKPVMIFGKAQ